ncbi:hypothetical protein QWJ34_06980 [Saccharibacillus sp. CPCC 101409]|uniref:hypothetical protein n=1 Tax=Saccharibacillus sp. CPCC 101409 TaxID=3058041 RepID=UPI0026716C58|nr:hypothetical protein [Saccharibacillus sp. CPCC 101409]MDO3409502.1 hypothetical protein [Saccharibacillus sp. CPCC 101409]
MSDYDDNRDADYDRYESAEGRREIEKETQEKIVEVYRQEEDMMILVYAQWCVNNDLDPAELYASAYPEQLANERLERVLKLVVSKEEAGDITDDTLLGVLSMFGNEDLGMVVAEAIEEREKAKRRK